MNEQNHDPLNDLMPEAYSAPEAPERLAHRLSEIAEQSAGRPQVSARPRGRFGRFPLVAAGGLMAVAALAAFQYFFGRTGEAAIALIPSDAGFVVSLDTNPSESQLVVYTRIGAALRREGLDSDIANLFDDGLNDKPLAKRVKPYLTLNFALGMWKPFEGKDEHSVVLVAVKDRAAVQNVLQEEAKPVDAHGVQAFVYDKETSVFAVIDNYFVAASDVETLSRVAAVKAGREQAITGLSAYREARSSLPSDANLMVFVSPEAMSDGGRVLGTGSIPSPKWFSVGAALRDGGIQFDWRSPLDAKRVPGLSKLAGVQPIDMNILRKLPEGAYGVVAISQLGRAYPWMREAAGQDESARKGLDEGVEDFEKETGLDVERDIVPAFQGDVVLAGYPGPSGAKDDIDGVLLIDAQNGGTPAALAEKVRALVEKQTHDSKTPVTFTESQIGDATVWTIDSATAKQLQGAAGGSDAPAMIANKTVLYATVQGSVVVTSSKAMLSRSIAAFHGASTLADDPSFAKMATQITPDSQFALMLNVGRIMSALEPTIGKSMGEDSGITSDDIAHIFGGPNAGLVVSGRLDGDVMKGSFFLPIDYDRMAKVIRRGKDSVGKGTGEMHSPGMEMIPFGVATAEVEQTK